MQLSGFEFQPKRLHLENPPKYSSLLGLDLDPRSDPQLPVPQICFPFHTFDWRLHSRILQIHPLLSTSLFGANKIPHILKPLTFGVDISTIRGPMYVNSLRAGYYLHILWQHVLKHKSGRKQNAYLRLFVAISGGTEILCMDKLSPLSEYLFSNKILQPRSKRSLFLQ